MESTAFTASPDTSENRRVDIFDEYALRSTTVLDTFDDVEEADRANYQEVILFDRNIFVRNDVMAEIKKTIDTIMASHKKIEESQPGLFHGVHRVLRPLFKEAYKEKDERRKKADESEREELLETIINNNVHEEQRRVEVAEYVASFPLAVQKSLKEGIFLIESEGRYYPTVEEGVDSFAIADAEANFKSDKSGSWKKGLIQTLHAGSPYVTSSLPATISGVVNRFKAELKDGVIDVLVTGNSFSTLGDNNLTLRLRFKENGEEKEVVHSFKPF